jgi:tRNA(fMet)-specific endonuclease VapC
MDASLLDTDILSEFLKEKNAAVAAKALAYLQEHGQFTFSGMTRFEIRRGYLETKASRRIARFDVFCERSIVLPITDRIFDRAAELWAEARQSGRSYVTPIS